MLKKKVKINYLAKDITGSQKSSHYGTRFISLSVEGSSTKRYHNSFGLLVQLSRCARLLLDFIVEKMDENNLVKNDGFLKKEFNNILKRTNQNVYGSVSINKAFVELTHYELLKSKKKKGTYRVNPLFFCNGSDKKREALIREYMERPVKAAANKRRKMNIEKMSKEEKINSMFKKARQSST